MQVKLDPSIADTAAGKEAGDILRNCVHCGFCNATCPTYQLLGNELDGPRGRIYQIKNALEGGPVGHITRTHLDRCLGCMACEDTCPSGVQYHRLLDIGRAHLDAHVPSTGMAQWRVQALLRVLPFPRRFALMHTLGRVVRGLLPKALASKLKPSAAGAYARQWRTRGNTHAPGTVKAAQATPSLDSIHAPARRMISLVGCVQPRVAPATNAAAAQVLNRLGITLAPAPRARCCGSVSYHLGDRAQGLAHAKHTIDCWTEALDGGAEAVAVTASGCHAFIAQYPELLASDAVYAAKAKRVAAHTQDLAQVIGAQDLTALKLRPSEEPVALHCPCTLRNSIAGAQRTHALLQALGVALVPTEDTVRCCGSAGTYSITQPALSSQLLSRQLAQLTASAPQSIVTANAACQNHLQSASEVAVYHWIELVATRLPPD